MKINPVTTALFAKLGANAGCASPLSLTGVLAKSLSEKEMERVASGELADTTGTLLGQLQNYNTAHLFFSTLLSGFIFTLIIYVATKSYKVKADNPLKLKDIPKFNRHQIMTVIAIIAMVILCIGFKLDTGLTAFVAASILILLGAADEKKAIKGIPWGTLVFICGVGTLINVINKLGGISMVSDFLTTLMGPRSATPILAATSGILSWVSSTTGVVMPALYPIAAEVVGTFAPSVNFMELIAAIVATSFAAAISPLSTGGAIIMSSISASKETTNEENNRMFKNLFLLSVANVCLNVLLAALGVFSLAGLFS
jgi:di/tricarboxylate transporter